jgi:hypothetical protein
MARRMVICALLAAVATPARADELADGEALAKAGRFEEAIAHFKALDARGARAIHACYVALAYRRLERWGQAELWADRCRERARPGDAEPSWAGRMRADIDAGMARRRGARVSFTTEPAAATLAVSAFAPDERFAPRAVFLPFGEHRVIAEAEGRQRRVEVVTVASAEPMAVHIVLPEPAPPEEPKPAPATVAPPPVAPVPAPDPVPAPARSRSPWPLVVLGAGGASLATGVVFHALAAGKRADAGESAAAYDASIDAFERNRAVAIGAYVVAAAAIGVGVVLLVNDRDRDAEPRALVAPFGAGGLVRVTW